MTPDSWPGFWAHVLATLVGVVIGLTVGWWVFRPDLTHGVLRRASSPAEVAYAAELLALALDANRPKLERLAQLTAQHQAVYDTGLEASAWDALQPFLAAGTGTPIRPRLAHHFARVANIRGLSDLLLRYTVGPESALDGASQLRRQLQDTISSTAAELDREAGELAGELRRVRSALPAPK
jgi:hypothetical protein